MNAKVQNEIAKVAKTAGVEVVNGFVDKNGNSSATRSAELVQFKTGDIVEFPTDLAGQVVKTPIRGAKDEDGNQIYASYIPVSVTRTVGGKEIEKVVPFYPSSMWKRRQECDASGHLIEGAWHNASGEVAEYFSNYPTVDEGIVAIGQHGKVKIAVDTFKTLKYGDAEGSKPVNTNIMTFEWA